MEMLGLLRCAGELSNIACSASSNRAAGSATPRNRKPPRPRAMSMTPLRRSIRLAAATPTGSTSTNRRPARLNGQSVQHKALPPKGRLPNLLLFPGFWPCCMRLDWKRLKQVSFVVL